MEKKAAAAGRERGERGQERERARRVLVVVAEGGGSIERAVERKGRRFCSIFFSYSPLSIKFVQKFRYEVIQTRLYLIQGAISRDRGCMLCCLVVDGTR